MPSTNPFRSITPIPRADKLFLMAQNSVMKTSVRGTSESVPPIQRIRKKEAKRIELLSKELRDRLFRIVEDFPRMEAESIPPFYIEILDISFGLDKIRKTLGSFSGAANVIWKIKREHLGDVWHSRSVLKAKQLRRAAFGRMKSVIIKLDTRLEFVETVRAHMRMMPGIDLDQPTICIAGYPNVGKSSLVNAVTAATPEIGAYPFTTKEVTLGHLEIPIYAPFRSEVPISHISCQIVDTPGLLDRSLTERNEIEMRAIAALKNLATAIVFILDFTQDSSLISQKNLFDEISQQFAQVPILIICGKEDILNENQKTELRVFWKEYFIQPDMHILSMNDKDKIKTLLINFYEKNQAQIQQILNKRKFGETS
ncbi:MAG: 50S ribosome-binding GTPase [Candidatus Heimdallarchaeota archaeon]|nr:MAG: 50S ribosome-binding GTPase [Candidatus Heimdallarchaeota archaeon]